VRARTQEIRVARMSPAEIPAGISAVPRSTVTTPHWSVFAVAGATPAPKAAAAVMVSASATRLIDATERIRRFGTAHARWQARCLCSMREFFPL
jgi:hypothetical protein